MNITDGLSSNGVSTVMNVGTTKEMTTTSSTTLLPSTSYLLSSISSSPLSSSSTTATRMTTHLSSTLASATKALTDAVTFLTATATSAAATTAIGTTTTSQTVTSALSTTLSTTTTTITTTLNASVSTPTSTILPLSNSTVFQNQTFTGITTEASFNISDLEREAYLAYLQNQTTREMIPAMTYLIILAVVGLIGNSLVLIVYSRKFRQTPTRVFIMSIAGFDLVTNIVVIPGEIYDMFHIWDFNQPILCKIRLYFNAFTTMVAAIVLVAVAVVRYRKICTPFGKQVSITLAKILSVSIAVFSLVFSVPYAIINGRQTKQTPRPGIYGYECTIDDNYVKTIWPIVNSGFFVLLFFSCCGPLVILYIRIGVKAWKHSKIYGVAAGSKDGNDSTTNMSTSGTVDTGTRSTDETPVRFNMSTRTKSYVKKKGEGTGDSAPAPSRVGSEKNNEKTKKSKKSIRKTERESKKNKSNEEDNNDDDANVIEYATDDSMGDKSTTTTATTTNGANATTTNNNNNNYSARMIRSPRGDKVQINLNMVRELTVKLKAVQKETEQTNDEEEVKVENVKDDNVFQDNDSKTVKFKDEESKEPDMGNDVPDAEEAIDDKVALRHSKNKKKSKKAKTPEDKTSKVSTKNSSNHKRTLSKSLDDIFRLTGENKSTGKQKDGKTKAAENEDLDLPVLANESEDNKEPAEDDGHAPSTDEQMSDFAKAMQWVDITYCLKDNKRESANMDNENPEDKEVQNAGKKTSFSISRKVSRDNSFLQRHRKLRDTLTDTLTRARKNKRDRELAGAENGNADNGVDANILTNNDEDNNALENDNDEENTVTISFKQSERKASRFFKFKESKSTNEAKEKSRSISGGTRRRGLGRTTCMLICISAVYILGFLPFLALAFTKAASPGTFEMLDTIPQTLYYLFLRSYFLNCAANPIVYSLCDVSFRRECFQLLKCSWCQRRIY